MSSMMFEAWAGVAGAGAAWVSDVGEGRAVLAEAIDGTVRTVATEIATAASTTRVSRGTTSFRVSVIGTRRL